MQTFIQGETHLGLGVFRSDVVEMGWNNLGFVARSPQFSFAPGLWRLGFEIDEQPAGSAELVFESGERRLINVLTERPSAHNTGEFGWRRLD